VAAVRWTRRALDDLREISDDRVFQTTDRLVSFPQSGRLVPELPDLVYRELLVGNYRVQYRVEENTVWIVTVVHGRRLLTNPA
jgi:toxin ParE1/3/4